MDLALVIKILCVWVLIAMWSHHLDRMGMKLGGTVAIALLAFTYAIF